MLPSPPPLSGKCSSHLRRLGVIDVVIIPVREVVYLLFPGRENIPQTLPKVLFVSTLIFHVHGEGLEAIE